MVKLTESRLRRIFKEEVASVMKSRGSSRLNEGPTRKYSTSDVKYRRELDYAGDPYPDGSMLDYQNSNYPTRGEGIVNYDDPSDEDLLGAYLAVYEHESESVSVEAMARALKSMGLGNFKPDEVEDMIKYSEEPSLEVDETTGMVREFGTLDSSMGDFDDERESNAPTGDVRRPRR